MTALERLSPGRSRLLLFLWSLALRAGVCALLAAMTGVGMPDLSIFFDGHLYQLIARTFPQPYAGVHALFPGFPKSPEYLTCCFPLYPALIWAADALLSDLRLAALAVSWLASSLAVVAFYELARRLCARPLAAALAYSFLPPTWLLTGSLAFVEPVFSLCFVSAMGFFIAGRRGPAVAAAALAILAQRTGVLILPVFLLSLWKGSWTRAARDFAPYLAALLPVAALQLWFWRAFGDPFINVSTHHRVFGGSYVSVPLRSMLLGLLETRSALPNLFWTRKLMMLGCLAFYAGTWAWCRRERRAEERPLLAWLGLFVLPALLLSTAWGYYAFPRVIAAAAPAAILLLARRAEHALPRWWPAAALLAPFSMLYAALDALGHIELWARLWPPEYVALLARQLASWR